jgi:hypothetical protein
MTNERDDDLRAKVEQLTPAVSTLTSGVFKAGYDECKRDVLALLSAPVKGEVTLLDELANTAAKSTSVGCISEVHAKIVELRFRDLTDAHAYLDAIVKLGAYYQARTPHTEQPRQ